MVVGVVTGVGEAAALGLRLVSGPLADRSRRFWAWTIAGYTLTVVTVPLLGIAGALWVACALVIAERVGKAVRGPAKDTLLSHAASVTGRGRGFAVHEALDQVGAMIGPLTVAGMLAITGNAYAPALGVLTLPGGAALALLLWLQRRVGRHVSNAPRAIPGASCLRIRVCAGGSDVGRNGSHPREKVTPRALDNVSWLRAASRTSAYRLKM